ncbi:MAG TPA: hypothetical protein VEF90_11710 [Xanthobacteraceae bacterium]|nr:hypothetical protein [Xanthobacteraceae bacterium]
MSKSAKVVLKRVPLTEEEIALRKRRLDRLVAEAKKLPTVDDRSADEIVGYNASGHFD